MILALFGGLVASNLHYFPHIARLPGDPQGKNKLSPMRKSAAIDLHLSDTDSTVDLTFM